MSLFDVYPLFDITPTRASGCFVYNEKDEQYLDFYGGHAVISIGHSHPEYIKSVTNQLEQLAFYSNSIQNPLQTKLADRLKSISGCLDYNLFLCNSGAEANENALKIAAFHTNKSRVIAFKGGFHGRTSGVLSVTDNPKLISPYNTKHEVDFVELNDFSAFEKTISKNNHCAVIIEGIQGIGGMNEPTPLFLETISKLCKQHSVMLIIDEIQSGCGRSGKFFAHQFSSIKADIITMAKGMGNGFPIGGVLISSKIKAEYGQLGTTFGGNHLACSAALAVLEVIEKEQLIQNAQKIGTYLTDELLKISQVKQVKGKGLMLGVEFDFPVKEIRKKLLFDQKVFTGSAANQNMLRLLPPLNITEKEVHLFLEKMSILLNK